MQPGRSYVRILGVNWRVPAAAEAPILAAMESRWRCALRGRSRLECAFGPCGHCRGGYWHDTTWPLRFHLFGRPSDRFFRDLAHCVTAAFSTRRLR